MAAYTSRIDGLVNKFAVVRHYVKQEEKKQ